MKNIIKLLVIVATCVCMLSCTTTAVVAQDDGVYVEADGNLDVRLIMTYGIPYYSVDDILLYYWYRGVYYRPRYLGGRIYAFDRLRTRPHFPHNPVARTPHIAPSKARPGARPNASRPNSRINNQPRPNVGGGTARPSTPAPSARPGNRAPSSAPSSPGGHAGRRR